MNRRRLLALLAPLAAALTLPVQAKSPWTIKPVMIVVPAPAGN